MTLGDVLGAKSAFPIPNEEATGGLTKLELFALVLGAGYLASHSDQTPLPEDDKFAEEVLEYAEALLDRLAELAKPKAEPAPKPVPEPEPTAGEIAADLEARRGEPDTDLF